MYRNKFLKKLNTSPFSFELGHTILWQKPISKILFTPTTSTRVSRSVYAPAATAEMLKHAATGICAHNELSQLSIYLSAQTTSSPPLPSSCHLAAQLLASIAGSTSFPRTILALPPFNIYFDMLALSAFVCRQYAFETAQHSGAGFWLQEFYLERPPISYSIGCRRHLMLRSLRVQSSWLSCVYEWRLRQIQIVEVAFWKYICF